MSALLLPPAALLVLLPRQILQLWTGNPEVAAGAAPLLALLVGGTAMMACSYPALSLLYGQNRLRPVVIINLAAAAVLLPLLVFAISRDGAAGAAMCWVLYGSCMYASYQVTAYRGVPSLHVASAFLRDFLVPCVVAFATAALTWRWCSAMPGRTDMTVAIAIGLLAGWVAAFSTTGDLLKNLSATTRWNTIVSH
jgi:O-antigen/teichoic acid export membrane protein